MLPRIYIDACVACCGWTCWVKQMLVSMPVSLCMHLRMCLQASATARRLEEAAAQANQVHAARQQQLQEEIQQLQAAAAHSLSSHSTLLQELQQQCAAAQAAHWEESSRAAAAEAELAACRQQLGSEQGHVQQLQQELGQVKQQLEGRTSTVDR